jgi:MerR family transcriptional regulator, light-induced transcriptional regulator
VNRPTDTPASTELVPITEVERQTGIRQATLRMWEKRYGFPQPLRDRHGDRVYPPGQVERLHAVRRLIDQGVRPGKIFTSAPESSDAGHAGQVRAQFPEHVREFLELLRSYRLPELRRLFQQNLLALGLRRFVIEFLAPLSSDIGLAWNRGELPVRFEHLFSQLAISILYARQSTVCAGSEDRPKVVLATLSGESHALGILMAEAVLLSLDINCIQLGSETPPSEVAAVAIDTGADIVALSFSASFPRKGAASAVAALRSALPPAMALWIGGDGARGIARNLPRVTVFDSLDAIEPALEHWRADPASQAARARS